MRDSWAKCYLIVPLFANTVEKQKENQRRWAEWLYSDEAQKKFEDRKVIPVERSEYIGRREIDLETGTESVVIDPLEKGETVRNNLESAYRGSKGEGYSIMIDGDGDIPYNYIFDVVDALKDDSIDICLSCRKGELGMIQERCDAERFELNLVENVYRVSLPDGQCGCWGLSLKKLPKLNLSARGYGIELDVLISALESRMTLAYVPITLSDEARRSPSGYRSRDHRLKLELLMEKLKLTRSVLLAYYEMFKTEYGKKLGHDYENTLEDMKATEALERKLQRCKEREICDRCDRKMN